MTDVAVRCENLSRRYGEVQALYPLNLEVAAGSIFGFLGRNGAGKTTAIRLLTGLARPSTGSAWVAGVNTTLADSAARAKFGYLPQDPAFYNWMSAREYLDYAGRLFGMDKTRRQRRVDEMLGMVGLTEDAKRPIRGFSGGMVQRLGIAQALLHEPPVLFLDEPTSALDPAGRYELLALVERLRGQVTVFLSSHILADVERVCDVIGIIRQGELLLVAEREALLAQYATDVLLLELDGGGDLTAVLQEQSWVTEVVVENGRLRVRVADVETARQAVLPLLAAQEVVLHRLEWIRPSLEEIFLALSA